jgi:hypothetical protein
LRKGLSRRLAASAFWDIVGGMSQTDLSTIPTSGAPSHGNSSPHVEFIDVRKTYDGETLVV